MKVQSRYAAAKRKEADARDALVVANNTDDIEAKAHAFADVICAEQKCSDASDEPSRRKLLGAGALAAEDLECRKFNLKPLRHDDTPGVSRRRR
jgi:hypothetical protein